jgi:hypothetical protein
VPWLDILKATALGAYIYIYSLFKWGGGGILWLDGSLGFEPRVAFPLLYSGVYNLAQGETAVANNDRGHEPLYGPLKPGPYTRLLTSVAHELLTTLDRTWYKHDKVHKHSRLRRRPHIKCITNWFICYYVWSLTPKFLVFSTSQIHIKILNVNCLLPSIWSAHKRCLFSVIIITYII